MNTTSSLPDHRRVKMAIQNWLQWPIDTLFKATKIRKTAKLPTLVASSKTRRKATNSSELYISASYEIEHSSSEDDSVMMEIEDASKHGDANYTCGSFDSTVLPDDPDLSIVSDMLLKVSISPPQDNTTSSCCLPTLPMPNFQLFNMSIAVQDPVKGSFNLLDCQSLLPGSQANYDNSEPRGWKRKSADDARPLSPQPEKRPLRSPRSPRSPSRKTFLPRFFTDYNFIPCYTEPRSTVSASEVQVKRGSPETCFSTNERAEKRFKYENEATMDVDNPFLSSADASAAAQYVMVCKGTKSHRHISAGDTMEVEIGQVEVGTPEVDMSDDEDEDDVRMELDDTVFRVTSFKQAAGDGWMWVE